MGRRRRMKRSYEDGARDSLGDVHVAAACTKLDNTAKRECALYLETFEAGSILPWLFDEDLLRRLRAIHGVVETRFDWGKYTLLPGVDLTLFYTKLDVPAILPKAFKLDILRAQPLLEAAHKAQEIHQKYARVKTMLRWFTRNATPGAIRNYWPAVVTLCPSAPALQDMIAKAPARYSTPSEIGAHLPLIRETARTVAGMEMLPADATMREIGNATLSLAVGKHDFEGVPYWTDGLTINL